MTILDEIIEKRKKSLIEEYKKYKNIDKKIKCTDRKTISENIKKKKVSIISEIKPSSPTLGEIRQNINISYIAKEMENSGVIGLSILTEPNYFQGSYKNLQLAIESTSIPCLMKDFVVDELQLMIANYLGATNILLINLIGNVEEMYQQCMDYNLEPLIEIHYIEEIKDLEHLFEIGFNPKLIGVNNRNLKTLKINLNNSKIIISQLRRKFGNSIKVVSESGIYNKEDIEYVMRSGADATLIGTSIMQSENIKEKILSLRGLI
ncbi:MAG: indole-3-glycerol phosphate synthase TrpC [Candidatus Helarchaeota archaeon]